jgi:hypothetical protein
LKIAAAAERAPPVRIGVGERCFFEHLLGRKYRIDFLAPAFLKCALIASF